MFSASNARATPMSFRLGSRGGEQDVAQNMAAFFQNVFMDQALDQQLLDQTSTREGEGPSMSPVELAGELVGGTSTCKELGYRAFDFFEVNCVCINFLTLLPARCCPCLCSVQILRTI